MLGRSVDSDFTGEARPDKPSFFYAAVVHDYSGCKLQVSSHKMQVTSYRIQDAGRRLPDTGFRILILRLETSNL
jgi:hypothetical protein